MIISNHRRAIHSKSKSALNFFAHDLSRVNNSPWGERKSEELHKVEEIVSEVKKYFSSDLNIYKINRAWLPIIVELAVHDTAREFFMHLNVEDGLSPDEVEKILEVIQGLDSKI